jgi:hypothetical protein
MEYKYEPRPLNGGRPPKHKWSKPHPAVVVARGGEKVGMCPSAIPKETLEKLLNDGIPWFGESASGEHPLSIFNVYEGVPYRAVRTRAGISFHGFPCVSRRKDVPGSVYPKVMARAKKQGVEKEVIQWFKDHP